MHRRPPRRPSAQRVSALLYACLRRACSWAIPHVCAPQLPSVCFPAPLCIRHALPHCLAAHFPMAFNLFVKKFLTLSTTVEPSSASGGMMVMFSGMYLRGAGPGWWT